MKVDTWVCVLEFSKCTRENQTHGVACHGEGMETRCDMPDCKEWHGNHRDGWRAAYAQGWYHKGNLDYCPSHVPPRLLAEMRERNRNR